MDRLRGRRSRWIGLGAGLLAALIVIVVAGGTPTDRLRDRPGASGSASVPPAPGGPLVYYEILDAEGSRLMERRLDGRSLAREVAERTDVDYGRTWTVDPTGTTAIAMIPDADDQELQAVSIATGAPIWSIRTPTAAVEQAAWSADGRVVALATIGTESGPRTVLVINATDGRFTSIAIPDDVAVQGFERDGGLILRQRVEAPDGANLTWRFLRVDPGAATIEHLAGVPDVGPASDWSEDVDPAAGLAVETSIGANGQDTAVRLWTLAGGAARTLATLPSIDRIAFDPGGTGVAISAAQTIRFVAVDGRASNLFTSPDPIGDFAWSVEGDYLAVSTDRLGPNLTVVERASGRSVELPHPDVVAQLLLVRIVGGVPLPHAPLPAVEPSASPTAGPSGADVAGFNGLLSAWVDRTDARQVAHVERLVPTVSGGLRVAAEMPPLDLGPPSPPDEDGAELRLLPRPGSRDILVWVRTADRSAGWLWDGAAGLKPLRLPADWPADATDVAWRPDGLGLAASAGRATADGGFQPLFVVAALADRATTVVPVVGDYDRLEGWWSSTELQVGHGICTEGCSGRFAWSARLRIRDHRLVELTPADRSHGGIDEADIIGGTIVLSVINDDPTDDIVIDWPADLGSVATLDSIQFAADGRTLLVSSAVGAGTDLYRIVDPVGRAVGGRLRDPQPVRLLHLDRRSLQVDVSPDGEWATVVDRVDNVRLVRLWDGKSWPVDRDRTLGWPGAQGGG